MEKYLQSKIQKRIEADRFRQLKNILPETHLDFCSNDYYGLGRRHLSEIISFEEFSFIPAGSTGSRLISGNHPLITGLEQYLENQIPGRSVLTFTSGYQAALSVLSTVTDRHSTVFFDSDIHASWKDAMRLSDAGKIRFKHQDYNDLEKKISNNSGTKFILTESIFSMDGSLSDIIRLREISLRHNAVLIIDEAHATGILHSAGGAIAAAQSENEIALLTFGKAIGSMGAAVIGSENLKKALMNFGRTFIYTTAIAPVNAAIALKNFEYIRDNYKYLK